MVIEEIIEYIKSQRLLNISDLTIKANLVKGGKALDDINRAFHQIDFPEAQASVDEKVSQIAESIEILSENKPKIIKYISIVMVILTVLYVITTINMLGVMLIIEYGMGAGNLFFSFLRYFPTFGLIPIMFSLVTLFLVYITLKLQNGSKFSFWLSTLFLAIIPIFTVIASYFLMLPFTKIASSYNSTFDKGLPISTQGSIIFRFGEIILILSLMIVTLLLLSTKKFIFINNKLSKKAKIFLISLAAVFIFPTFVLVSIGYLKAIDNDYGFNKAKLTVKYHIYRASVNKLGLTNVTKFVTDEKLAGKKTAVSVAYDVSFLDSVKGVPSKPIVIKQVGVEQGFDLNTFAENFIKVSKAPQKITLSKAANKNGYLIQNKNTEATLNAIVYLTHDNVLITLVSPKATAEELIKIAESLE